MRVAVGACGPTPLISDDANALFERRPKRRRSHACRRAAQARADPLDDVRGSADYRRLLIPRLLLRAVRAAEAA